METIDKWIKTFKEAGDLWGMFVVVLMAGIGFIFGLINIMMWFIEKTGEIPEFIFMILKGFDILIYTGILIFAIKYILLIIKKIKKRK